MAHIPSKIARVRAGSAAAGAALAMGASVAATFAAGPALASGLLGSSPATADLMDHYQGDIPDGSVQVAGSGTFRDYGGRSRFSGRVATVKCFENNPLVRQRLTREDGEGRVLVVDGGGSTRCALMGDMLAKGAVERGWSGVIINGAVRDTAEISLLTAFGCKALASHPAKSQKVTPGEADVPVTFAGIRFRPGQYVYADEDGVVVSDRELRVPPDLAAAPERGGGAGRSKL